MRSVLKKISKAIRVVLLGRTATRALLLHGVAAAVEHIGLRELRDVRSVIDVGANRGQFSILARSIWPEAQIISFEPLSSEANVFSQVFQGDELVRLVPIALGDRSGTSSFHVADRRDSSSLLRIDAAQEVAFGIHGERDIEVTVGTLDDSIAVNDLELEVILKIDVQGGELGVLKGCGSYHNIKYIYLEVSFVTLYENQPTCRDLISFLFERGYDLLAVFNIVNTKAFGCTQADFLFIRGGTHNQ